MTLCIFPNPMIIAAQFTWSCGGGVADPWSLAWSLIELCAPVCFSDGFICLTNLLSTDWGLLNKRCIGLEYFGFTLDLELDTASRLALGDH